MTEPSQAELGQAEILNPIVSLDETDHVHGFWYGAADDASVMVTLYRRRNGALFATGRVRVHKDDKLFGSADPKFKFELESKPRAHVGMFKARVKRSLQSSNLGRHFRPLKFVKVEGGIDRLRKVLEKVAMMDGNFRVGIAALPAPETKNERGESRGETT